jgi:hypothetical protein
MDWYVRDLYCEEYSVGNKFIPIWGIALAAQDLGLVFYKVQSFLHTAKRESNPPETPVAVFLKPPRSGFTCKRWGRSRADTPLAISCGE